MAAPPLRIALLAHVRHPIRPPFAGGMEAHTWHLARGLAQRGHDVTLFASGDSEAGVALHATVDEHYERRLPWAEHHGTARLHDHLDSIYTSAWHQIEAGGFDVVHNNAMHPLPLRQAARCGMPMLTCLHVPPFAALRRAVDASGSATQRFTVTSEHQASLWWPSGTPAHADVVHNGIDTQAWPYRCEGDRGLVWAGRIAPNKGTDLAARTARLVGMPLSIVGPIEDGVYFQRRVAPWLDERIRHVGHLDGDALASLFGRGSALLFTPRWDEPFGLVAVEAMACGLPVASTDRGAVREVVAEAGAFAEREDPASLADALRCALSIARQVPRQRVERCFTLARMLAAYEARYRACIVGGLPSTMPIERRFPLGAALPAASDRPG